MEGGAVESELKRRNKNLISVTIRVYGQGSDSSASHGYIVDDVPTSISPPVGTMDVDAKTTKLSEMRDRIEFNRSGHMNRRTLLFQEALFIMSRLPNYYDRPKSQLTRWQFGYVKKGSDNVKMIHPEAESQTLFAAVPDLFSVDVVIVPLSQVPPEFDSMPPPAGDSAVVDNGGAPAGTENAHNEND